MPELPGYPDEAHATSVCRKGQGAACCRYLLRTGRGWTCAKLDPELRQIINDRVTNGTIGARGDNCDGIRYRA